MLAQREPHRAIAKRKQTMVAQDFFFFVRCFGLAVNVSADRCRVEQSSAYLSG
jgi:hypothetical protein